MKHLILFFFLLVLLLIFASVFGKKQPERSQKTVENTHGKMRALSTDAERLISDIQSIPDSNSGYEFAKLNEGVKAKLKLLENFISGHEIEGDILNIPSLWCKKVNAELYNGVGIILISGYHLGNLIFLDAVTSELKLAVDFHYCIESYKSLHNPDGHPETLFVVHHNLMTGTGTLAQVVRIYAIEDGNVALSLMKPNYEYNTGWGLFKDDLVEFCLENEYPIVDGAFEIYTTGLAIMKNSELTAGGMNLLDDNMYIRAINQLPRERYVWNDKTKEFDQVEGRKTKDKVLATSVYSDFANPKSDWFTPPEEINPAAHLGNLQSIED